MDGFPFGAPAAEHVPADELSLENCATWPTRPSVIGPNNGSVLALASVISGRSGSGKTHLLRLVPEAMGLGSENTFAATPSTPSSRLLIELNAGISDAPDQVEAWTMIWRAALLGSIASIAAYQTPSRTSDPGALLTTLGRLECVNWLTGARQGFQHPYTVLSRLGQRLDSSDIDFIYSHEWDEVADHIEDALAGQPPRVILLDRLDDTWDNAPRETMLSQIGLVESTLRLAERPLGGSVRVACAVRDVVLRSLRRRTGRRAQLSTQHVISVSWDRPSLASFVDWKMSRLPLEYLLDSHAKSTFGKLTGVEVMTVPQRGSRENIDDYVLRHTSGSPRDVVIVGNDLAQAIEATLAAGDARMSEAQVKEVVAAAARDTGLELITHAVTSIQSATSDRARPALSGATHDREMNDLLRNWIAGFGSDTTHLGDLRERLELWTDDASQAHVIEALWDSRLVGVLERSSSRDHIHYAGHHEVGPPQEDDTEMVFHPSMVEVARLRPTPLRLGDD